MYMYVYMQCMYVCVYIYIYTLNISKYISTFAPFFQLRFSPWPWPSPCQQPSLQPLPPGRVARFCVVFLDLWDYAPNSKSFKSHFRNCFMGSTTKPNAWQVDGKHLSAIGLSRYQKHFFQQDLHCFPETYPLSPMVHIIVFSSNCYQCVLARFETNSK